MKIEKTLQGLQSALSADRSRKANIGFVPTMGNLHDGHIQLIQQAKLRCDVVVVSIFVNPTQFAEGEDFDTYPRTLEADCAKLVEAGCDILFTPSVEVMYGNRPNMTQVLVSEITDQLCGLIRPGHFAGVATVVTKLFNMVQPHQAFFGEKDYQQLAVIQAFTKDLFIPIEIVPVPTQRAADGLALSSRNIYLTDVERGVAPTIYNTMLMIKQALLDGERRVDVLIELGAKTLIDAGFIIDYVALRTEALTEPNADTKIWVILIAAKLGKTRLIDNLTVML